MGKNYRDLSRRGLIRLNQNFDAANDAALLDYLTEHGDDYENIRPVEKVIERFDTVKDTLSASKQGIRNAIIKESDRIMDAVINVLETTIDTAENAINK